MNEWHNCVGTLVYRGSSLVAEIDPEIGKYYRGFIPKSIDYNIPRYPLHVTVVRGKYENAEHSKLWKSHDNKQIEFEYNSYVNIGKLYIWISARGDILKELRFELGLDECFDKFKLFHATIANMKQLDCLKDHNCRHRKRHSFYYQ